MRFLSTVSMLKEQFSKLEELYKQGKSNAELCDFFGRNSGAINARIQKLELEKKV